MKTLRKAFVLGIVMAFVTGYFSFAYAKTASVVTHATIIVLPRQEVSVPSNEELTEFSSIENEEMTTKMEKIETPYGEKIVYTMIGIL